MVIIYMRLDMEEETLDEILNGLVRVYQKKRGYRFSLDSILLSHFVSLKQLARVMDIGCGSGIILFILAKRYSHSRCSGLEIQANLAGMAQKSSRINGLEHRVDIIQGDARDIKNLFSERSFDTVIFNPPYRKLNSGRVNPHEEKAIARHEINGSLNDFLKAANYLLKPRGNVYTIYPAKRLVELVYIFRRNAMEPKRMKLVFSDSDSDAAFVLAEGKKGSREELKMEPPLFIYDRDKHYSQAMSGIFNELSRLPIDGGG